MKPAGLARLGDRARHALDEFAVWQVDRVAGRAVGEAGRADFGPPKAKVSRPASASSRVEAKGRCGEGVVGGDADVFGAPAIFAAGRDVGIDAAVGRVAGARDAAVMDPVENPGSPSGFSASG